MQKPIYNREYLKYGIRHAHKPQAGYPLSGAVIVSEGSGIGYAYVKFTEELVKAVGLAMPQGVGTEDKCFLRVTHRGSTGKWKIYAYYLDRSKGILLWETVERPSWLKKVRRNNGTHTESTDNTSGG